jgi:SAM-dependent methyltransferase
MRSRTTYGRFFASSTDGVKRIRTTNLLERSFVEGGPAHHRDRPLARGRVGRGNLDPMPWKTKYEADELVDVACPGCARRQPLDLASEFGLVIAQCGNCGLVYTRTRLADPQGHYHGSVEEGLAKYRDVFEGTSPHGRDANYEEHLDLLESLTTPGDLLDIGSHCGFFLRKARGRGWRVLGVEPSPGSAQLAREQFGLDVKTATLEDAHMPDASFDVVTLLDVFEHIGAPRPLLNEIRRILRPGGRVFIKVPNARYVLLKHRTLRRVPGLLDDVFDAREHLVYYSDATLRSMLETCGFRVDLLAIPSPIQAGSALRKLIRASGSAIARRMPHGTALPLATDIVAVGRR